MANKYYGDNFIGCFHFRAKNDLYFDLSSSIYATGAVESRFWHHQTTNSARIWAFAVSGPKWSTIVGSNTI